MSSLGPATRCERDTGAAVVARRGEEAVGLLGRWGYGMRKRSASRRKGPERILVFPESRVPGEGGRADQKVVLKFGVGKDKMRQNSSRGNDGHHQISGFHPSPGVPGGQRAAMLPCTIADRPALNSGSIACGPHVELHMHPSPQHLSLFHRKPNDQRQSLSLNFEGRCDLAPWRCCISVCSIQNFSRFLVSPADRVLFGSCVESRPAIRQWHRHPGTGGVHNPLQPSSGPVFGSDLGFVLSRYRTTRKPFVRGPLTSLDPRPSVVAHKSTAPPSDVDGDFVELAPSSPFQANLRRPLDRAIPLARSSIRGS